jgi:hypothetical protein
VEKDWQTSGIIKLYLKKLKVIFYRYWSPTNGKSISGIKIKINTLKNKLGMNERILVHEE